MACPAPHRIPIQSPENAKEENLFRSVRNTIAQHLFSGESFEIAGDFADPNDDGLSNLVEVLLVSNHGGAVITLDPKATSIPP